MPKMQIVFLLSRRCASHARYPRFVSGHDSDRRRADHADPRRRCGRGEEVHRAVAAASTSRPSWTNHQTPWTFGIVVVAATAKATMTTRSHRRELGVFESSRTPAAVAARFNAATVQPGIIAPALAPLSPSVARRVRQNSVNWSRRSHGEVVQTSEVRRRRCGSTRGGMPRISSSARDEQHLRQRILETGDALEAQSPDQTKSKDEKQRNGRVSRTSAGRKHGKA